MVSGEQPLTRRALHRPQAATRSSLPRPVSRHAHVRPAVVSVQRLTLRLSFEAVAAATAVAFLAGAVTGVAVETADRQDHAAFLQAEAQRERADHAATARLTAGAAQYAAAREHQALAAAQAALVEAQNVMRTAPALVGDTTVDPLDEAVTQLAVLVDSADRALLPAVTTGAEVSIVANAAADLESETDPTPTASTSTPAAAPSTPADRPTAPVSPDAARGAARPEAGATLAAPDGTAAPATEPSTDEAVGSAEAAIDVIENTDGLLAGTGEVLDLDASAALLAAAERVTELSAQVRALSDVVAVELADAEEAARARAAEREAKRIAAEQAALEAARARTAARIAAADGAPNGRIPLRLLCHPQFSDALLRCDAAAALDQLNAAYRAHFGRDLAVSGGYRTLAEQEQVRATKGDLAARPGTSNHGRGLAVDFSGFGAVGQFNDADYLWMVDNGPQFGWVHPRSMGPGGSGPLEPWHWEFGNL